MVVDNEYVLWDNVSEGEEQTGELKIVFIDGVEFRTPFDEVRVNLQEHTKRVKG